MRSAAASIKITPCKNLPMGGNVRVDNMSRGTHDDLLCNILLIENKGERICLLSLDLLGIQYHYSKKIKSIIEKRTGINQKDIVISCTHTHSGPDVTDVFKKNMDEECERYLEDLAVLVADGVDYAAARLEAVKVCFSKKNVFDLSFNRRLIMKDGSMRMNWEGVEPELVQKAAGPVDPELQVLSLYNTSGKLKSILVNFTLHPAVLVGKDWLWSRDYINYSNNFVKKQYGDDIVVLFTNGAEGNINHINYCDKSQGRGFEEARRIGEQLGEHIYGMLQNAEHMANTDGSIEINCISREIELPLRTISREVISAAERLIEERGDVIPSLLDGVPDEMYAREIIKLSKIKEKYARTEIQAVKIGDVVIVTLPGEVFVEFGLEIKAASPFKHTMVFGLTNDFIGYIPTQAAFTEGGYEIKTASSSKLDKTAGDILATNVIQLMHDIFNSDSG